MCKINHFYLHQDIIYRHFHNINANSDTLYSKNGYAESTAEMGFFSADQVSLPISTRPGSAEWTSRWVLMNWVGEQPKLFLNTLEKYRALS